uniref:hypothetical protein n=1 Tax=Bacillus cytotoxicus TaxID=580165 RepID=UPI003EBBF89B
MSLINEAVTLNHVSKYFGKKQVIQDISFSVHEAEIFGLVGPSEMYNYDQIKTKSKEQESSLFCIIW